MNLKKRTFAKANTVFVGHVIGSGHIRPDPRKLQDIGDLQPPKMKKEGRSMIDFCSYSRAFNPALAETALSLTTMTQNNLTTKVQWGLEHQNAFDNLKHQLTNVLTLHTLNFHKEFEIISVDASGIAGGCCLFQDAEEGVECPVAIASTMLSDTQTRGATTQWVAYGVVWVIRRWILVATVTICPDHNPFTYLTEAATKSAKLTRWICDLPRVLDRHPPDLRLTLPTTCMTSRGH